MTSDFFSLRSKHSQFIYQNFSYKLDKKRLKIEWHFHLKPNINFTPKLEIELTDDEIKKLKDKKTIDNLIFNLGVAEMISYWKVSCAPEIVVEAGYLDEAQIKWWQDLFIKGLGEFFYTNQIDFTVDDFFTIACKSNKHYQASGIRHQALSIIPIGGGKDSTVTAELLKTLSPTPQLWSVNPIPAAIATSQIAGYQTLRSASRTIDPKLLELNKKGYLNGHTPFSAYLSFFYALIGFLTDRNQIILSNEQSANECNTTFKGHDINHQYSKSFEYEQKFRDYSQKYLIDNLDYFSFLRPINELQIAQKFASYPDHFSSFRSCNVGQKQGIWCHKCPKCLFAFLMIFPFVKNEQIVGQIFESNLFEDTELLSIAFDLVLPDQTKPFDCVGSYEESKIAFYLAIKKYRQQSLDLPFILQKIDQQVLINEENLEARATKILKVWDEQNNLNPMFKSILKEKGLNFDYQPLTLKQLEKKKIAILGLAREGLSTYHFLRNNFPNKHLVLLDQYPKSKLTKQMGEIVETDKNVEFTQITDNQQDWKNLDLIFKSPGIPSDKYQLEENKLTSNTQLFFDLSPGKIIGVTGTKGKSTTTSLIAHVLTQAGKDARLAGNIGLPLLETLDESTRETIFVCELSSHQLEFLYSSPNIAVIQPILPEHLDYYHTLDSYIKAKANITNYQTKNDLLIFNADSKEVSKIAESSNAQKIPFGFKTKGKSYIENQAIFLDDKFLIELDQTKLRGKHNLQNILPAVLIANHLQIDKNTIIQAIKSFQSLPHRLELVATIDGVEYFNDSLATNPGATIAAIEAFDQPIVLITGGFDRGVDYSSLAEKISATANIKKIILLPDTGLIIKNHLAKLKVKIDLDVVQSMKQAVELAKQAAKRDNVVLMSPASASFNMFKDYADRGEQFRKEVERTKNKE